MHQLKTIVITGHVDGDKIKIQIDHKDRTTGKESTQYATWTPELWQDLAYLMARGKEGSDVHLEIKGGEEIEQAFAAQKANAHRE